MTSRAILNGWPLAAGQPASTGIPTLTLTGPLTYSTTSPSGTLVANIGNVPAGVTPTLTPNDGRLVIAGSAGAWTVVTGLSASTAGTITLAVAAAGANGASAPVTIVSGGAAALTFPAAKSRYDIDFENARTNATAPIPSNAAVFPSQPYDGNNNPAPGEGRFFRLLISPGLPAYAEDKNGSLRKFTTTQLRRGTRGLCIEQPQANASQVIAWTNDLTQTGWVPVNMTALANQTSRNGLVNTGTLLTATAANATILYPVTLAASQRNFYADIKRIAGTGTVEMTLDGGATWVVAALTKPRFNGWGRYKIPLTAVTNPSFGFRLGTSGDQIAVAFCTSDLSGYELTPWEQVGTLRNRLHDRPSTSIQAGSTTPDSSGLVDFIRANSTWGILLEWDTQVPASFGFGQILKPLADGTIQASTDDGASNVIATAAGVHRVTTDPTMPLKNRALLFVSSGTAKLCVNGGPVVTATGTFGAYTVLDHKDLFSNGGGTANGISYVQRLIVYDAAPTDAEMIAWTT